MNALAVKLPGGQVRFVTELRPVADAPDTARSVTVQPLDGEVLIVVEEHGHDPHCTHTMLGARITRDEWAQIAEAVEAA